MNSLILIATLSLIVDMALVVGLYFLYKVLAKDHERINMEAEVLQGEIAKWVRATQECERRYDRLSKDIEKFKEVCSRRLLDRCQCEVCNDD